MVEVRDPENRLDAEESGKRSRVILGGANRGGGVRPPDNN